MEATKRPYSKPAPGEEVRSIFKGFKTDSDGVARLHKAAAEQGQSPSAFIHSLLKSLPL
jgi:hypothetical protein